MVVVCRNAKSASTADFIGYTELNYKKFNSARQLLQ